jgi:hypothetical protein
MTVYTLYIYDRQAQSSPVGIPFHLLNTNFRHCTCVYYQDWHRTKRPKAAIEGGILPAVSRAVTPLPSSTGANVGTSSAFSSPRNTLSSNSGLTIVVNETSAQPPTPALQTPPPSALSTTTLSFDEEAKLVYGVILSLRNMIRKLSGRCTATTFFS